MATQLDTATGTLPIAFAPSGRAPENAPGGAEAPAAVLSSETLMWPEITYRGRTFVLNKDLVIRVTQEGGGWSFAEDEFRLLGFGHTRSEAELMFCYDFSYRWDEIACERDERLSGWAQEMKRAFLGLVGGVK